MKAATRKKPSDDFAHTRSVKERDTTVSRVNRTAIFPHNNLFLQRHPHCACGGHCPRCRSSEGFLQPKLRVNAPNDKYEREADRMAEEVMRLPAPSPQHQCAGCTDRENEADRIQPKPAGVAGGSVSAELGSQIQESRGGGRALEAGARSFMEYRFGTDFGRVRVHTDNQSALMNERLRARAFTVGSDIYFDRGAYRAGSAEGRRLLAHELTHVIQQGDRNPRISLITTGVSRRIQRRVRHFVCDTSDQATVNTHLPVPLSVDDMRVLVSVVSDLAADWTRNAARRLRRGDPSVASSFTAAFTAPMGSRIAGIVSRRLENVADELHRGAIQYYCWGSADRCPECPDPASTYWACSSWGRRYVICLGRYFWNANVGDRAATLIHEMLHIYYGRLAAHAGERQSNVSCYERFIYDVNHHPVHSSSLAGCP